MSGETVFRSIVKTVLYRFLIIIFTAAIFAWAGRDMYRAIGESIAINIFYMVCYYINERVWANISWGYKDGKET